VITPYKGKNKPESRKQSNRSHARLRRPGDRAECAAQILEDPPELQPRQSRLPRQGHLRPTKPRSPGRMKRAQ
jgi:hypothetical protein